MCDDYPVPEEVIAEEIESLVSRFGHEWRDLITDSITWLRTTQHNWKTVEPLDGEGFIAELLSHVSKD